jgi:hypothetical protein
MGRLALFLIAVTSWSQTSPPGAAKATVGNLTLSAENLVHSMPTPSGIVVLDNYLVIQIQISGPPRTPTKISTNDFALHLNGRKTPILAQYPAMVASSVKQRDWLQPSIVAGGGIGNAGIILGRPTPTERFPGDPTVRQPPPRPRTPDPSYKEEAAREPEAPLEERVARAALPEGERTLPVTGLLFFPFKGKTASIRSMELQYASSVGQVSLKLQ